MPGNKYLLDTHAFLWAVASPDQLSTVAREAIEDTDNMIVVSAASAWEIATKWRIGTLPGVEVIVDGFSAHVSNLGAELLPISADHALLGGTLDWGHRDPFDRMLAAQSRLETCTLITADKTFNSLEGFRTAWN